MLKRLVLYFPQQVDAARGLASSKHLLPLSLLAIAGWPLRDGYEVVLIDGNLFPEAEAHRRVVEACDGALLYATTGILGHQVADGLHCTRAVKARHPDLPCFIGGWFASAAPELQLAEGLYDAVALGQGELTFRELVAAVDAGEPLDGVAGLALWRDGQVVRSAPRATVGWEQLVDFPWQLVDFPVYAALQREPGHERTVEALPPPPGFGPGRPFVATTYFSSFGCPLDCTFCCSPLTAGRRWKSMPAERMLDDVAGLHERWGFDVLHFYDANWAVNEKRVRDFSEGLLRRGVRLSSYAYLQSESVMSFAPETLDLLAQAGLYAVIVGAETGSEETMRLVHKPTRPEVNLRAAIELDRRGVSTYASYVIGFPGEGEESMLATLDQCRRMAVACPYSAPTVWAYQPIPGAALYPRALEAGFRPPASLEAWGRFCDYRREPAPGWIPPRVARMRKLYNHFTALMNGTARRRIGVWERRARARLEDAAGFRRDWPGGLAEARAFQVWHALERRLPRWAQPRGLPVEKGWKTRHDQAGPAASTAEREEVPA